MESKKTSHTYRILGIDPGFGRVGYGIIECTHGGVQKLITHGCIETDKHHNFAERLEDIADQLMTVIRTYRPSVSAVEELFFYRNVTTAIQVGQARGAILLTLRKARLPIYEYTPLEIKQSMTGYGRADKRQMQEMVKVILGIKTSITPDDAVDALAVALTAATSLSIERFSK